VLAPFFTGGLLIIVGAVSLLLWLALRSGTLLFVGVAFVGMGALIIWGYNALLGSLL